MWVSRAAQRQPQQGATDGDKQKNSQDAVTEKQIPAFLASRYPKHPNYKRGKAKMVARRLAHKRKAEAPTGTSALSNR
jgi:hypothetical protein